MTSTPWFHKTSIYQIYPRSFDDSNGDGIGDIPGIIRKLDYIWDLGFETIWCSPFFQSPQRDFGYDISDYRAIAPEYGTLADVQELIDQVHRRRMRIIFDMVMNHTSDQHPWFLESRSSRDNPRADWYIWRDKPNNWRSHTRRSGWCYSPERKQYYWASFLPFQPDLNYRNPQVKQAMFDVVRFWLEQGVDGFRLDMFNAIYKHAEFVSNPLSARAFGDAESPSRLFQALKYNINQPESFAFAEELRQVCDAYGEKLLLGEVSGSRSLIRQFMGKDTNSGLGLVFDFSMLGFHFSADFFRRTIAELEHHFPDPFMPVYVFSNHDTARSMTRNGNDLAREKLLHLLQLTVRGVPCVYYGEELGMKNAPLSRASALDPVAHELKFIPDFVFRWLGVTINRDEVRTPMQWDASRNAGFSTAEATWLPVAPDSPEVNVAVEKDQPGSMLNVVENLLRLRAAEPSLHSGSLQMIQGLPDGLLAYSRHWGGEEVAVFLNFTSQPVKLGPRGGQWLLLFNLSQADDFYEGEIVLDRYGGVLLKRVTQDIERTLEKARRRTI